MSPSENIDSYARGWSDLMKLVRNGYSWSGHERNRFFLNGQKGSFHELSHLAGLDHVEDGRGLAILDWDQDGRPDLWFRNRNAPRLRLMLNRRNSPPAISLKLQGTNSNRDAIGAVVELLSVGDKKPMVRSVKAGDLFLSQSSKWLHFGLGKEDPPRSARVIWPGGKTELFTGLNAGRFLLKEDNGKAIALPPRPMVTLKNQALVAGTPDARARIILPARVPFPALRYRDPAFKQQSVPSDGGPRLLVLWSDSCPNCKVTLEELVANAERIKKAKLGVVALSVDQAIDPAADPSPAYDLVDRLEFPFPWGLVDRASAKRIHRFQERLFDRTPPPAIPLMILLDDINRALAIYRGQIPVESVLRDFETLKKAHPVQLYHLAPPMKGTWFTNPLAPRDVDRLFGLQSQ